MDKYEVYGKDSQVLYVEQNKTLAEISRILPISERSLSNWKKQDNWESMKREYKLFGSGEEWLARFIRGRLENCEGFSRDEQFGIKILREIQKEKKKQRIILEAQDQTETGVIRYRDNIVLTTEQLANYYEVEKDNLKVNFNRNKNRYVESQDFFVLTDSELQVFKDKVTNCYLVGENAKILYLWTESGALLHAKSLNTDKAWEVYMKLMRTYFRAKKMTDIKRALVQNRS